VAPGHIWSTYDVHTGLHSGLKACGIESHPYAMDVRLDMAARWIKVRDGEHRKTIHEVGEGEVTEAEEETTREVIFLAGAEITNTALSVGADAVIVVAGLLFDPRLYMLLQRARIPVFMFGTESPYNDKFYQSMVHMVGAFSTNDAASLPALQAAVLERKAETEVIHMALGYDPDRHYPGVGQGTELPAHDVVFVGNVYPSREQTMAAMDWCGIDLALYGVFTGMAEESRMWQYVRGGASFEKPFGTIDNRAAAALYDQAKITLNLFRKEEYGISWTDIKQSAAGESINPRLIEAAACGAFMISEYRPEVEAVFGETVPTFKTPEEGSALVRYYLEHEDERLALAAQLPGKVAAYSYHVRAREILDVLEGVRSRMRDRQLRQLLAAS
jgi:CO dehydrogenase/acetyl-CoA synthase epsilon subunit